MKVHKYGPADGTAQDAFDRLLTGLDMSLLTYSERCETLQGLSRQIPLFCLRDDYQKEMTPKMKQTVDLVIGDKKLPADWMTQMGMLFNRVAMKADLPASARSDLVRSVTNSVKKFTTYLQTDGFPNPILAERDRNYSVQLELILAFEDNRNEINSLVFKAKDIASSDDDPGSVFRELRDIMVQVFEKWYLPAAKVLVDMFLSYIPDEDPIIAHAERLLCVDRYISKGSMCFSDVRCTRNAFSHRAYHETGGTLVLDQHECGLVKTFTPSGLAEFIALTAAKSEIVFNLVLILQNLHIYQLLKTTYRQR